ncbi:RNA polymerase sigma factor RpoD/SigA [bacterium]|nr:RNA polymerase sigma factor RpoD/SigA [bacterium]
MHEYESNLERRTDPALKHYLRTIGRYPLLSREQEQDLARRIRGGDGEALDAMVNANLRFVVSVAKRYLGRGLSTMDLIAEGNVGLITAARRFDERRDSRFITYAVWWVRQAILTALQEKTRTVRLPANRARDAVKIAALERRMNQSAMGETQDLDLARELGLDPLVIGRIRAAGRPNLSLDDQGDGESPTLAETLADPGAAVPLTELENQGLEEHLAAAMAELDQRERGVLASYFGLGQEPSQSLESIGQRLRLSRERVRQIRNRAMRKLREGTRGEILGELARG